MSQETVLQRIRLTYARREELRYISNLDMHQVWERTLRRARLPLAYSKGFHPNPRLHLASALPLGFLSQGEIVDIWLDGEAPFELERLAEQIQASAPPGLQILTIDAIPLQAPPLQTQLIAAEFCAQPLDPLDPLALAQAVDALLAAAALPRERRGKPYDLRPLVDALEVRQDESVALFMRLAARESATGRPEEVLLALGLDPASFRVERLGLILA